MHTLTTPQPTNAKKVRTHPLNTQPKKSLKWQLSTLAACGIAFLLSLSTIAHSFGAETADKVESGTAQLLDELVRLPALSQAHATWLGQRIFANECASRVDCLTSWNAGEDFPSLGIGHFIWYQESQSDIFEETFPDLLDHLRSRGVSLPRWLARSSQQAKDDRLETGNRAGEVLQQNLGLSPNSPWLSRDAFYAEIDSPRMAQLRDLLIATQAEQAEFIVLRLEGSIDNVVAAAPGDSQAMLTARIEALAAAYPLAGLYALIDYVHFKGTGVSPRERYQGTGWGLLQVLEGMSGSGDPLEDFVASAKRTLQRRVDNSPPARNEGRWLAGWSKRLDTYLAATMAD